MYYPRRITLFLLVIIVITVTMTATAQEAPVKILAWIGNGVAPGEQSPDQIGQIVYLTGNEQFEVLFDLPPNTTRVMPCSEQATSPDGRYFAFFAGGDTGSLYWVDGANTPVEIDTDVNALACLGMGTFQYSPDGSRFGYIDYTTPLQSSYAAGWFYVLDAATQTPIFASDSTVGGDNNVAAFDISNDAIAFVSLYLDADADVKEAAIFYQAGTYPVEISTLYADENCDFRSLEIAIIDANTLALVVAQHCENTEWALYRVNITQRSANRTLVTGNVAGGYYAVARSNVAVVAPDGNTLYLASPNGLERNIADIQAVNLTDIQTGAPLLTYAVMPLYNGYTSSGNAWPGLSPDGNWWAVITNTADGDAAVNAVELGAPDLPPITVPAPARGNTISALAFTPNSSALLFVAGGNNTEDNSLFALDLVAAAESRVMRGRFGAQIVVAPDGQYAALPNWRIVNAPNQPNYLTLIAINLQTGEPITVFTGAEVVNDVVSNQRFVYPLSWRG